MAAESQAEKMRVLAIYDVQPTSDLTDPDYNPYHDPTLNIQYPYDQVLRTAIVEKKPEDFSRLNHLLFDTDWRNERLLEDNPVNRVLTGVLWNTWSEIGGNLEFNSDFVNSVTDMLGLPFEQGSLLTPEQVKKLKTQATLVADAMRCKFQHIYRNHSVEEPSTT